MKETMRTAAAVALAVMLTLLYVRYRSSPADPAQAYPGVIMQATSSGTIAGSAPGLKTGVDPMQKAGPQAGVDTAQTAGPKAGIDPTQKPDPNVGPDYTQKPDPNAGPDPTQKADPKVGPTKKPNP